MSSTDRKTCSPLDISKDSIRLYKKDCSFAWLGPIAKPSGCIITCKQDYERIGRNIVLDFDLSSIPPDSEVISAMLRLHAYSPRDNIPVVLYGLTESFSESEVSWQSRIEDTLWKTQGGSHELGILDRGTLANFFRGSGYYMFVSLITTRGSLRGRWRTTG